MGIQNSFVPGLNKPRFRAKLRYGAASLNFTSLTSQVGRYVFTANGLFDPNITGGALAPAGFSQLISTYEHYTVTRCNAQIIFTNNSTTPALVAMAVQADTSGSNDPNNMLELPFEQVVQLEPSSAYGSSKTLSMSIDLSRFFGEPVLGDQALYRGDATSNPPEQAYLTCFCYGLKGGAADVFMTVKLEYHAVFTEPRELTPSLTRSMLALVLREDDRKRELQPKSVGCQQHFLTR